MKIFLFFSLVFPSLTAFAYPITGAVTTATGGAGVSVVSPMESPTNNPAAIPFYSNREVNLSYSKDRFAAFLTDNGQEALFPASVGYEQHYEDDLKNTIYHLIIAYPLFSSPLSFGINYQMHQMKWINNDQKYKQNRLNAGLLWKVSNAMNLGVTYKNKALNDTDLPDAIDNLPLITAGFNYAYMDFIQFRADIEKVDKSGVIPHSDKLIFKFGLETYLNDWIIARFGYRNDNITSQNFSTYGLGFAGPQFSLNYGYQRESKKTTKDIHLIDLSFPF